MQPPIIRVHKKEPLSGGPVYTVIPCQSVELKVDLVDLVCVFPRDVRGVVGAGGAGFPSYAKLNEKADTIILNCAECEPYLTVDYMNLKTKINEEEA